MQLHTIREYLSLDKWANLFERSQFRIGNNLTEAVKKMLKNGVKSLRKLQFLTSYLQNFTPL